MTLFQFGRKVICDCGEIIDASKPMTIEISNNHKRILKKEEEERYRELQRDADRICSLILMADYPEVDIEIEKEKLREKFLELFPDKHYLYKMIYESRFKRLFEQFRGTSK